MFELNFIFSGYSAETYASDQEEEKTSFIVVNPAHEVTEDDPPSNVRVDDDEEDEPKAVMVKCCERGVEASDAEEKGICSGSGEAEGNIANGIEWLVWRSGIEVQFKILYLLYVYVFKIVTIF